MNTPDSNGKKVPSSNHRRAGGALDGGNFTFEDGHVEWINGKRVLPGSTLAPWVCFFKIPLPE